MEITGSALTALFVGLVWTLMKVVEYFISKRNGKKHGLTEEQDKQLKEIYEGSQRLDDIEKSLGEMDKVLDELKEKVKHLDELHSVYDDNRVPKWYVSSEILPTVRKIHTSLEMVRKEMEEDLDLVKSGQFTLTQRVLDLLSAQKLMVERLGDIITRLNKSSE